MFRFELCKAVGTISFMFQNLYAIAALTSLLLRSVDLLFASLTAQGAGSTSCGVNLRTLVRTPIFSDGNHIVLLTLPPGTAPGGASRSLFGGGGPIPSLRCE